MPIRINLLAEVQAAEDLRRRDPVKRAIALSVVLIVLMLGWVGLQHTKVSGQKKILADKEAEVKNLKPNSDLVMANRKKNSESEAMLLSLRKYMAARFLWGSTLNGLQQCMTNVPKEVQLVHLETKQDFSVIPTTKVADKTKPGSATERISILVAGRDYGKEEDLNYNKFRDAIAEFPYFKDLLEKGKGVSVEDVTTRQGDPTDPSRSFVVFKLQCKLPDRVR